MRPVSQADLGDVVVVAVDGEPAPQLVHRHVRTALDEPAELRCGAAVGRARAAAGSGRRRACAVWAGAPSDRLGRWAPRRGRSGRAWCRRQRGDVGRSPGSGAAGGRPAAASIGCRGGVDGADAGGDVRRPRWSGPGRARGRPPAGRGGRPGRWSGGPSGRGSSVAWPTVVTPAHRTALPGWASRAGVSATDRRREVVGIRSFVGDQRRCCGTSPDDTAGPDRRPRC